MKNIIILGRVIECRKIGVNRQLIKVNSGYTVLELETDINEAKILDQVKLNFNRDVQDFTSIEVV